MKQYNICFWCLFLVFGCNEPIDCVEMSNAYPIDVKKVEVKEIIDFDLEPEIYFSPLILPIKIAYSSSSGISIIDKSETAILTPLGTFGVEYSIGSNRKKIINGHHIKGGDFVVGLVNNKTNEKKMFHIKGKNTLEVIVTGETKITSQTGYVEIDITDSEVQELIFIDNSQFCIVNNTNETKYFTLKYSGQLGFSFHEFTIECEIPPYTYKLYPRYEGWRGANIPKCLLEIDNKSIEIALGDTYHISENKEKKVIELKKVQSFIR